MTKSGESKSNRLRVFEAFAGIGAQNSALSRINIDYEIVGISEWYINALFAYDAIHSNPHSKIDVPSYEEQIEYLKQFTFSADSVKPIKRIEQLPKQEIEHLYVANKRVRNYGSISEIQGKDLPEIDLLIYSFPCQDLSTGGKTRGMHKGDGTRSGLLWEVERLLTQLKELDRLPEYLLMENVKAIYADSNKADLDEWLMFLESIGYHNGSRLTLNAVNFGIPQIRERAFIISSLHEEVDDIALLTYSEHAKSIEPFLRLNSSDDALHAEEEEAKLNRTPSREAMWNLNKRDPITPETTINTITCNMDRSNTCALFKYADSYRRLTIREAFLFMGFTEEEYEKAKTLDFSYRQMNKLIGNSIVVNVLEQIFRVMLGDKYKKGNNYKARLKPSGSTAVRNTYGQ